MAPNARPFFPFPVLASYIMNSYMDYMKRKRIRKQEPVIAPGMDDQEEFNRQPKMRSPRGITEVVTLSYDEVDPL
jgi:Tfp pilus assembly protein PilE